MPIWIPVTIAAAFVQNVRFMLQKHLRGSGLSTGGATFSRFLFAAPLAAVLAAATILVSGQGVPHAPPRFWLFAWGGGLGQIVATLATVSLFTERNFAVGIAFTKTETVLVAIFSALLLGEPVSRLGWVAIGIGLAGVLLLSRPPAGAEGTKFFNRATALGLFAGAAFGASAIGYRGASLSLSHGGYFLRAAVTLACVTAFQAVVMAIWLRLREPGEVGRVAASWKVTGLVGLTGMLGSLGWFTAFTLQNAAYVRAVGQVEMVFTVAGSRFVFREALSARELLGIGLVVGSILLLILSLG